MFIPLNYVPLWSLVVTPHRTFIFFAKHICWKGAAKPNYWTHYASASYKLFMVCLYEGKMHSIFMQDFIWNKKKKLNILERSGLCRLQMLLQSAFSCGISIVCVSVWPAWSFLESSKWKCESSCLRLALCTLASRALCWHFWKLAASVQLPTKCRSFPLFTLLFYLWLRIVGMPINTRAGQTCHVFYMANCLLSQLCSDVMIL